MYLRKFWPLSPPRRLAKPMRLPDCCMPVPCPECARPLAWMKPHRISLSVETCPGRNIRACAWRDEANGARQERDSPWQWAGRRADHWKKSRRRASAVPSARGRVRRQKAGASQARAGSGSSPGVGRSGWRASICRARRRYPDRLRRQKHVERSWLKPGDWIGPASTSCRRGTASLTMPAGWCSPVPANSRSMGRTLRFDPV